MLAWIQQIDWTILHWIQSTLHNGILDFLMPKITALGNRGMIWIVIAVVLTITKKYRIYGIAMLLALAISTYLNNTYLKPFVGRPRPAWIEHIHLLIKMPKDFSFPSGHTMSSVIGAYILTAANRKFGYIAIPLAASIAFSRLYLFVHFPSDVLTSTFIGILFGALAVWGVKKYEHYKSHK